MADPHIYLGKLELLPPDETGSNRWQSSGGDAIGMIQLRSIQDKASKIPSGYAWLVYDGERNYPELSHHFGNDIEAGISSVDRSAIQTLLGKRVAETALKDVIREILIVHGEPTGQTGWKQLRGSRRLGTQIYLGGFGMFVNERFSPTMPTVANTIEVFRADYRRNVAQFEQMESDLKLSPQEKELVVALNARTLQKWTGNEMQKLYGRMGDDLMGIAPPEYALKGWLPPETEWADTFVEGSDTDLASHTPTGPNNGFSWIETMSFGGGAVTVIAADDWIFQDGDNSGDIEVYMGDGNLSSDGHTTTAEIWRNVAESGRQSTVATRMTNSAGEKREGVFGGLIWANSAYLAEWTNDNETVIGSDLGTTATADGTHYTTTVESTESDVHSLSIVGQGVVRTGTDVVHTGVLNGGFYFSTNNQDAFMDNWVVADIVAGGLSIPIAMHHYKQMMGVN